MTRTSALRLKSDERGLALVMVIGMMALLSVVSITLINVVTAEGTRSRTAVADDAATQAAEAGIQDYIAKLLDDNLYYMHYVHPGEATRKGSDGVSKSAGQAWTGVTTWTYPNGKDTWRSLGNGYEYDLEITPPSASNPNVGIVSTGRPTGSTDHSQWRAVQELIRPSSVSDFQMISDADISYGSTATTRGPVYAGIDSSGHKHNIAHAGVAYGNLYAEGSVTGSVTMMNGAQKYSSSTIRSVIPTAINFSDFLTSLSQVQTAAQAGGVYLNNTSVDAWWLTFQSNGTFTAATCTKTSGNDVAGTMPTCGTPTTYNVPVNGAVYVGQSAIISGQVNGRVTVVSNNNIIIGNNISYVTSGDDVLGLVANNNVEVAQYVPSTLNWNAATIAENGQFYSYSNDGSHSTMTFTGSTATKNGGSMGLFQTRNYNYDNTLLYLQPPWFPRVGDPYSILLERQVSATSS